MYIGSYARETPRLAATNRVPFASLGVPSAACDPILTLEAAKRVTALQWSTWNPNEIAVATMQDRQAR